MPKFFNIAGPCVPGEHYLLPALARLPELSGLIVKKQYFVIHAARQSGKTTLLKALTRDLTSKGKDASLYCSLEMVQGVSASEQGVPAILRAIASSLEFNPFWSSLSLAQVDFGDTTAGVKRFLAQLAHKSGKPWVRKK